MMERRTMETSAGHDSTVPKMGYPIALRIPDKRSTGNRSRPESTRRGTQHNQTLDSFQPAPEFGCPPPDKPEDLAVILGEFFEGGDQCTDCSDIRGPHFHVIGIAPEQETGRVFPGATINQRPYRSFGDQHCST